MRTLEIILAAWVVVSFPVAILLGQVLKRRGAQYPTSDERYAEPLRQSKCGCWQSTKPSRWPWFAKPGSYITRWSPVWLGGDEYCRRTLVLGWGIFGLVIIPLRECRGCEDCGSHVLDGVHNSAALRVVEDQR